MVRIDSQANAVVIGTKSELGRADLKTERVNWLIEPPTEPFRALAQIRYNSDAVPASIEPLGSDQFAVTFDEPALGVAPGQLCVLYDQDRVLGGGWIC